MDEPIRQAHQTKFNLISWGLLLGLGSTLFLGGGCAFGTRHAQISYPPAGVAETKTNLPPAGSKGPIAVQTFQDERGDKNLVGHVRNGWGMKTADVVTDHADLAGLVTGAVQVELRKDGYEVVMPDLAATNNIPVLSGSLTQMYCDAYFTYDGQVTLVVQVTRAGHEVYHGVITGKGSAGMNWAATQSGYGDSLSLALKDAIDALLRDLPAALQN